VCRAGARGGGGACMYLPVWTKFLTTFNQLNIDGELE